MSIGAPESPSSTRTDQHRHEWQVTSVEYDDGVTVIGYDCLHCDEVWFS